MPEYDAETALIVVDVQNDFADAAGGLAVPGGAGVVAAVNAEIAAAEQGGALVVYTQDWHPERTRHFQGDGGPWPSHCVGGDLGRGLPPGAAGGERRSDPQGRWRRRWLLGLLAAGSLER